MTANYDNGAEVGLVWWKPYQPEWLWYKPPAKGQTPPDGWLHVAHNCDGYRMEYLYGWVKPVTPSRTILEALNSLANEVFAKGCSSSMDLGYGADAEHRAAYTGFLNGHGLEAGDLSMLMNAVYPLAPTEANLRAIGAQSIEVLPDAFLLVLGWNCD